MNFSNLGVGYEAIFGDLQLYHQVNLLANPEQAFIEGWAEFVEVIFSSKTTPPYSVTTLRDSSGGTAVLGPPPLNRGENVEGAFANALWGIFKDHVVTSGISNAQITPESRNGVISTNFPWIANAAVKGRFRSMIWEPFKALSSLSNPSSTAMIERR